MKIISVGPDELIQKEFEYKNINSSKYKWIVYFYKIGSYEGHGQLVALNKNKTIYIYDLGHCSCYGPLSNWGNGDTMTLDEFIEWKTSVLCNISHDIMTEIDKLLDL
jgi:hypothetical protein